MNRVRLLIYLPLTLLLVSCGGSYRPVTDNPKPLGFIPFTTNEVSGSEERMNQRLLEYFASSGSFHVIPVDDRPALYSISDMQRKFPRPDSAAGAVPDTSLAAGADSLDTVAGLQISSADTALPGPARATESGPDWILTGKFVREREQISRGTRIPWLLFKPSSRIIAELEYRLYDRKSGRWSDIRQLSGDASRNGSYQVLEFEPADPSLALSGRDRHLLREAAYDNLLAALLKHLEKIMEIKR